MLSLKCDVFRDVNLIACSHGARLRAPTARGSVGAEGVSGPTGPQMSFRDVERGDSFGRSTSSSVMDAGAAQRADEAYVQECHAIQAALTLIGKHVSSIARSEAQLGTSRDTHSLRERMCVAAAPCTARHGLIARPAQAPHHPGGRSGRHGPDGEVEDLFQILFGTRPV